MEGPRHRWQRIPARPSERQRVPQPLLRSRIPSKRGAMEQPNVTGDGDAALDLRFWVAVVITGVVTGLAAIALMALYFSVQHLAVGHGHGPTEVPAAQSAAGQRIAALLAAGVIGGLAWYLLRRATPGQPSELDEAVWAGDGHLAWPRSLGTSVISEVVVGAGASIGREAAPKLMGGVAGSLAAGWLHLSVPQRRLLVACGGGAGLAAVYNVPLGGALFAAEILIGSISLPVVLPAVVCSAVATLTGWLYLPSHATYLGIPEHATTAGVLVWSLLVGPVLAVVAAGYIRAIGWVSHHQPRRPVAQLAAPVVAFGVLGLVAIRYPELLGNGKVMAGAAFLGHYGIWLLLALAVLKPVVTSLCLGSGASGGLFTPFLATGALLGGFLGLAWSHLWAGGSAGTYAVIGAAAMIGAAMQAPLTGALLVLELTDAGFGIMVAMMLATGLATAGSRWIDGYSIYSARLRPVTRRADPG